MDNNFDQENNPQKSETENTSHVETDNQTEELEKNQSVFNESQVLDRTEQKETLHRKSKQSNFFKSNLMTAIIVGIISSLLTLTIVFYTPLFQNKLTDQTSENSGSSLVDKDLTPSEQTTEGVTTNKSLVNMIENTSKGIVGVVKYTNGENPFASPFQMPDNNQQGVGSGVIFKKDGDDAYVVTNNHVIEDAEKIEVSLESGEHTEATLVGADALSDLAVLKIDGSLVDDVLEFGDSDNLQVGEQVIAIGNPLGLDFSRTVTQGIVSALDRSVDVNTSAGKWELNVIQTDAAINPGNSGGALLNDQGKVIGINSLKIATYGVEGLGFAIPSNDALPIVEQLMKEGEVERPVIGITMVDLEQVPRMYVQDIPNEVSGGVIISEVTEDSAAHKAGIKPKDVIVEIDGEKIENGQQLRKWLYGNVKVGDKVKVKLYRGNEEKTVEMTLTSS